MLEMEGTTGGHHPVQPPCSSGTTQSRLLSTMSTWVSHLWEPPKSTWATCAEVQSLSPFPDVQKEASMFQFVLTASNPQPHRVVITEGNTTTTFSFKFQLFYPLLQIACNLQMRIQEHNILSTWFRVRRYLGQRKWNYKIILLSAYLENKEENPSSLFFLFSMCISNFLSCNIKHQNIKRNFYPQ